MKELKSFLIKQKYPENIINMGIDSAMNLDRTILRQVSQKTEEPVITYVSTHNSQQIRDPSSRMLHVSEHISTCANRQDSKYYIFPFYKMYSESTSLRHAKEKYFINLLQPKLNWSS